MSWAASVTAAESFWDAVMTEVLASRTEFDEGGRYTIADYANGKALGGEELDMTQEVVKQIIGSVLASYSG